MRQPIVGLLAFLFAITAPLAAGQVRTASLERNGPQLPAAPDETERDVLTKWPARMAVRDVSLEEALVTLRERSGVPLAFSPSRVHGYGDISCDCQAVNVGQALDRMLSGTPFGFVETPGRILVSRSVDRSGGQLIRDLSQRLQDRARAAGISFKSATAPTTRELAGRQGTVTGQVTEAGTERPLESARVQIGGTNLGAFTDAEGRFQIVDVPAGQTEVQVQLLGYAMASQVVNVQSGATVTVDFQLDREALALDEIVVVGYGAQSRETISGSVSAVSAEEITRTSATTTADALVGKLQGINTRMTVEGAGRDANTGNPQDGRPGASSVLQIRNMGNPLFVIDGVPTDNPAEFNQLNAADIASISVLKDASASVYGFRAANGVVLVETKRGDATRAPRIQLDGHYGWQNITRYHYENTANAYEYVFSELDSQNNRNQPRSYTPEELELWRTGAPGYESTNHYPLVVNNPNAAQYNLNASVSGGSQGVSYYLSLGHVNQDYVIKENNFNRTNLQANLSTSLTEGLRIGTELRGRYEVHDNIAIPGDQDPVRTLLLGIHSSWPTENPWVDRDGRTMIDGNVRYLTRSVASFTKEHSGWQEDIRRRLAGNFWAEYTAPFGTTVRATYSYGFWQRAYDKHQYSFNAFYCDDNATQTNCVEGPGNPARDRQHIKNENVETFAQISASHDLQAGDHSLSGVAAFELSGSENFYTEVNATPPNNLSHLIRTVDIYDSENDWGITRRASYAGRVNYDYQRKYLIELLGRYDGSYLYAPEKRWGFFPGITAAWRLTEEPFLRDRFAFLDELKLRVSWGQAGREQGIDPWGFLAGAEYGVGDGSVFDGAALAGLRPRGVPVTELSWVTSTSRNIGFDFQLFSGKLAGEIDLFERKLTGLPAARYDELLPTEVGYILPNENLESEANRGIEAIFRYNDRIGDVQYSVAPNVTVARRKVLDRYKPRYGNSWDRYRNATADRWFFGDNPNQVWGYEAIGQFQNMDEIENHPVNIDGQGNRTLLPGDIIYKDENGDGIIDEMDMRPIGHATDQTPILNFGLSTSFAYRGITLSADFAGATMYSHNRAAETKNMFQGGHNAQAYFMDRWHREDPFDPQSEWIPGRYPPFRQGVSHSSFNRTDTFWRTNVRYIRLRRVELGYQIPEAISSSFGVSGARLYVAASNPLTFDNVSHYDLDPEIVQVTFLNYPTTSVINMGFSATVGGRRGPDVPVAAAPQDGDR